jgi:hypothetical protein
MKITDTKIEKIEKIPPNLKKKFKRGQGSAQRINKNIRAIQTKSGKRNFWYSKSSEVASLPC